MNDIVKMVEEGKISKQGVLTFLTFSTSFPTKILEKRISKLKEEKSSIPTDKQSITAENLIRLADLNSRIQELEGLMFVFNAFKTETEKKLKGKE